MAITIRSISQGPAEKKKTVVREAPFSWAHLNITLHHSWYHTTAPLASANQLTSLGPCVSLIGWQPHSCRHGRGPPLRRIVGVEGRIRAWPWMASDPPGPTGFDHHSNRRHRAVRCEETRGTRSASETRWHILQFSNGFEGMFWLNAERSFKPQRSTDAKLQQLQ